MQKLFDNIDYIKIGTNTPYDFKSGYYDANIKELYIKNEKNIPALYLRLVYALTTIRENEGEYTSGYAITKLCNNNYKLEHKNFGINRAVISNLVCKLCDVVLLDPQIMLPNKVYSHNFLGHEIEAQNDIYSLEGKLLEELCFVLNLDVEVLYSGIFSKDPVKYLNNILDKKKFINKNKFLKLYDEISKTYNTYNKLLFLSTKLNDNYLEYKKHILNHDVENILREQKEIEDYVDNILIKLYEIDEDDEDIDNKLSLSEALEDIEEKLKTDIYSLQEILCDNVISTYSSLPCMLYASKLKQFSNLLITPNATLNKELHETVLYKIMPDSEITGINLVQKIKYALTHQILSNKEFTNISNSYYFYNICDFEDSDNGTTLILLVSSKDAPKVIEINGLNKSISKMDNSPINVLPQDNLKYAINSSYSNIAIGNVEKLYTEIKANFDTLSDISLENVFVFEYKDVTYALVQAPHSYHVIKFKQTANGYSYSELNLSERYKVLGDTINVTNKKVSTLPIIIRRK